MEKNYSVTKIGTINLAGKAVVSDPCYDRDVKYMAKNIAVKPGRYAAFIATSDEGADGVRVVYVMAVHEDYVDLLSLDWQPHDQIIGVDSGQCGIFDDTVYPAAGKNTGAYDDESSFYGECCQITLSGEKGGVLKSEKGVVSSSGFGDGSYELHLQCQNGNCIALMVDFGLITEIDVFRFIQRETKWHPIRRRN